MPTSIITAARDGTYRRWNPDGTQVYSIDDVAFDFDAAKGFGPDVILGAVDDAEGNQSRVIRINAADGSIIWNHALADTTKPRAVDVNESGVVVAQIGQLVKLTVGGSVVWSVPGPVAFRSGAIAPNGDALSGDGDGNVRRHDSNDGSEIWVQSFGTTAGVRGLAVDQSNSLIYVANNDGDVFRLNPDGSDSGGPYPINVSTGRIQALFLTDSLVLSGSGNGDPNDPAVHCYNKDGTFLWTTAQPDEVEGIAVDVADDSVYAGGRGGFFNKLALSNGAEETDGWPNTLAGDIKDVAIAIDDATEATRTVRDDATGDTVSGVRVVAIADNGDGSIAETQTSDTNGLVTFSTLASGTYALVAIDNSGNKIDAEYGVVIA